MDESSNKTSTQTKNEYNAAHYDSLRVTVPKGRKADVKAYADENGYTINGLVNACLAERLNLSSEEWKNGTSALWRSDAYYYTLNVRIPKHRMTDIEAYAKENNATINQIINFTLCEGMGIDLRKWDINDKT